MLHLCARFLAYMQPKLNVTRSICVFLVLMCVGSQICTGSACLSVKVLHTIGSDSLSSNLPFELSRVSESSDALIREPWIKICSL